ncbi:hypothetical protein BO71DRAFT_480573 [Aspergillus ellipticus CBS 707.79]|uniref:Inner kinetochore subunit AME1 domain-containing protein n=1 Tax=Aspergillus ellipticus CBS 707.79 TaxID=1448320 RepID=A0A319DVJ6_9EURO|nr:hypothetical protein BO71DRAFT_480573 [Aspergillus ellipticus CBS 707.79]
MASNREERQQMRQRGAALRKTKAVDFGFSFGMSPAADESSQPASRPADVGIALGAPAPPAPPTITTTTTAVDTANPQPPIVSPERNPLSFQDQGPIRRTPGSARNKRPPRPDTFDIPTEEPPEVGPSRKIRKLGHAARSSTVSLGARDGHSSQPLQNGVRSSATAQSPEEPTVAPDAGSVPPIEDHPPQEPSLTTSGVTEDAVPEQANEAEETSGPKTAAKTSPPIQQEPPQTNGTPSPPGQKAKGKRRRTSRDSETSTRSSKRSSPRNATSPKTADVDSEMLSEPMDLSSDGLPEITEPPIPAPEATEQADTVPQDASEPLVTAESQAITKPQATAEIQVTDSQATAEIEVASQPQGAEEKQPATDSQLITAPEITTEPQIAAEPDVAEPEVTTEPQNPIEAAAEPHEEVQPQEAGPRETSEPEQAVEPQGTTTETRSPTPPRTKRARGQRAASAQPPSSTIKESRPARAGSAESAPAEAKESKRSRGRIPRLQKPAVPVVAEEPSDKPDEVEVPSEPKDDTASHKETRQQRVPRPTAVDTKPKRAGRPGRKATRTQATEEEAPQPEEAQKEQEQVPLQEPEPVPEPEAEPQPEPPQEPEPSQRTKRGRRKQPQSKKDDTTPAATEEPPAHVEPIEETQAEPTEEAQEPEPSRTTKRGRRKQPPSKKDDETQVVTEEPPAQAEPEPVPEPETEPQPEPPQEPEPSRTTKRGRRRQPPSKKDDTAKVVTEEPPAQAEPIEEVQAEPTEVQAEPVEAEPTLEAQPKKRKPRQPRGETVPVTVHRLANAASLRGAPEPQDSSDEEEEPADEISARQKAKLPSRGGVNAADVLGQICRETLEKTLTTLRNGIENETNTQRRAEWTRKKKAVEAYGMELEGRLFELSEMLDSNFVLGRQVKKAKREMMDSRSRLYQIRKEREAVALQMDAVRRKHMDEETAKIARSSINNSLHSLDLALERNRTRPVNESTSKNPDPTPASTAGLEFLLRNVADNVSSVAPGAQGGLLHQIRSFNAQLEATARRLES